MLCGFAGEGVWVGWWWGGVDGVARSVSPVYGSSSVILRRFFAFREISPASETDSLSSVSASQPASRDPQPARKDKGCRRLSSFLFSGPGIQEPRPMALLDTP